MPGFTNPVKTPLDVLNQSEAPPEKPAPSTQLKVQNLKVLFGLIFRDKLKELPFVLNNIENLAQHFHTNSILFIENDSTDGSVEWVQEYMTKTHQNVSSPIKSVELQSFKWGGRLKDFSTLAHARNEILKTVQVNPKYFDLDFTFMLDTDLCHVWDVPLIIDVLTALLPSYQSKWDVIFGNGVRNFDSNGFGHHYDRFAYRDHFIRWNPSQGIFYEAGFNNRLEHMQPWWDTCYMNPIDCTPTPDGHKHYSCQMVNGQPLISVESAFAGFGIYGARLLLGNLTEKDFCYYSSPLSDCEHVPFNRCLVQRFNAKLVVAPQLLIPLGPSWDDTGCNGKEPTKDERTEKLIEKVRKAKV